MLSVKELENAKPKDKAYRLLDGQGLYLDIKPSGTRSWLFRYRKHDGRRTWLGLGAFPAVTAKQARLLADEQRRLIANGIDPGEHRAEQERLRADSRANQFERWARAWYNHKVDKGWSTATAEKCLYYIEKDILPVMGHRPVADINRLELNAYMKTIEERGAFNVAEKQRQWLKAIFSFAIANGALDHNPASELNAVAKKAPATQHFAHLRETELPAFLQKLREQDQTRSTALIATTAAWLVILTGSRPGMARTAEWADFDLERALWTIPAHKMKQRRSHIVPLSRQVIVMLRRLHELTGRGNLVFPGRGNYGKRDGSQMSENTINHLFWRMGYKGRMTGHGSRHTASTILNEHDWNPRWIDAQLSHAEQGGPKVRSTYNHAMYLEKRQEMMQWYADHLEALEKSTEKVRAIGSR